MSHSTETHVRLLGQRWAEAEQRDDTAIAIGRQTQQAEYQGHSADGQFRATHIAVRDARGWVSAPFPAMAQDLNEQAGDRADEIELAMNLVAFGDEVPTWIKKFTGADTNTLVERDSLTLLRGTATQMADELQHLANSSESPTSP